MRIILIGPKPPPYNGQSICFKILFKGLTIRGINFDIVNLSSKAESFIGCRNYVFRIIEYFLILLNYCIKLFSGKKVNVYLQISQSRLGFFRDFIIIFFAFLLGKKIIVHLHGGNYDGFYYSQPWWMQKIIKLTLKKVYKIIVLSEKLRYMFDFDKTLMNKIFVIHNCLSLDQEKVLSYKEKNIKLDDTIHILFLSSLFESKGYIDLLKAIDILVKKYKKNVICKFCGKFRKQYAYEKFYKFIEDAKLKSNVKYEGILTGKAKNNVIRWAHFFALTTNYIYEGQPLSIIEAIANGCVVISTNYRAIPDMLHDGKNGIFVDFGKPEQIALAIKDIVESPLRFKLMSKESIDIFRKDFKNSEYFEKIIPLLKH